MICLIGEFVALMAGVLAVGFRSRRSRSSASATNSSSSTKNKAGERKVLFTTDSTGQRKWQLYVESQARKKGIAIALLLGWIESPLEEESKLTGGTTEEASMYIGMARRNSSLGMAKANTRDRVSAAKQALDEAIANDRLETAAEQSTLTRAQQNLMDALEAKAPEGDGKVDDVGAAVRELEAAVVAAKQELEAATTDMLSKPAERRADIDRLRAELASAEEADRAAPEEQAAAPKKKFGMLDGAEIKNHLAPLKLATERNMSKSSWKELWPTLTEKLQTRLWRRGQAQLYEIIMDTLTDAQKTLITAANCDDQLDGLLAYRILRSHCYGSQEEWTSKLWNNVQNWSQDRGAQRETGEPRKLLDSIMMLEADIADYEATGERVTERNKLMILKRGLAKRQRPALEKIKNDLSGKTWDYEATVSWLLTWSRSHQDEIKKGESEVKAAWRSGRQGSKRAAANVAKSMRKPNSRTTGRGQNKKRCFLCGSDKHLQADCPKRGKGGGASGRAAANVAGAKPTGRGPRSAAGPGGRNSFRCANCGQQGHYARDCPKPPQKRRCFICGSDQHLQSDCPQRGQGQQGKSGTGRKGPPKKAAAQKAAARSTIKLTREKLKTIVKYANSNRNASTITLSLDNKGKLSAAASGSKPAPTTLMLIPMPVDEDAADLVASAKNGNRATRSVLDSGASKGPRTGGTRGRRAAARSAPCGPCKAAVAAEPRVLRRLEWRAGDARQRLSLRGRPEIR